MQSATVLGRPARRWALTIGRSSGVAVGQTLTEVRHTAAVKRNRYVRDAWTLSEVYSPYGDPGFIPAASALFRSGTLHGFSLWIGAGGD